MKLLSYKMSSTDSISPCCGIGGQASCQLRATRVLPGVRLNGTSFRAIAHAHEESSASWWSTLTQWLQSLEVRVAKVLSHLDDRQIGTHKLYQFVLDQLLQSGGLGLTEPLAPTNPHIGIHENAIWVARHRQIRDLKKQSSHQCTKDAIEVQPT